MDVNYLLLLAIAIIVGLAYGLPGLFADFVKNGNKVDWAKLAATIIYSIVVGVIAVQTGVLSLDTLPNWQTLLTPIWTLYLGFYLFLLYLFSKIVVPVASHFAQKTVFYPKKQTVDPNRKMDAETRVWLIKDQPEAIGRGILVAVDAAEAKQTWRYAIEAGAWIYLVEFGEVFGAKHYYFRGWFGSQVVSWKPITVECIETIRTTGRFPDYSDLY